MNTEDAIRLEIAEHPGAVCALEELASVLLSAGAAVGTMLGWRRMVQRPLSKEESHEDPRR